VAAKVIAAGTGVAGPAARDPRGEELAAAYRRLDAAYQQSLRYAEDIRNLYRQLQRGICQSLLGLANALEAKDPYTRGHSERVSRWSRRLGMALGLEGHDVESIAQAGLLHDIGKIGVPESVLRKPGMLDASEWTMMRRHPLVGAQIVAPFDFLAGGATIIRHHHERYDGSGYPDGLVGEAIPLGARVVAVADVYDALTSDRPYRRALSPAAAASHLLEQAGRSLDEHAVAAFLGLLRTDAAS
jgi:putative nucleotidyltransferase with HDIG domain